MRIAVLCLLSFLLASSALAARASSFAADERRGKDTRDVVAEDEAAAAALQTRLGALSRFRADFRQSQYSARGRVLQESTGELWADRPDRFRWSVTEPFPELLVGDGETLWLWDPDLEQVTIRPYDERMQATPARLLSGDAASLLRSFDVVLAVAEGDRRVFELRPKTGDGLFERLDLVFVGDEPRALVIRDGLGQRTEVRFLGVTSEFPEDPGRFTFEIPPGADVLRDDGGP